MKHFNPKNIKSLDGLTLTELLLMAFHFSPKRTDCVSLGFEYDIDIDRVWVVSEGKPVEVTEELSETSWDRLAVEYGYEQINWKKFVLDKLQSRLDNAQIVASVDDIRRVNLGEKYTDLHINHDGFNH